MTKTNNKIMEFTSESGAKYTFQKVTPTQWLGILDDVSNNPQRGNSIMYAKVIENIVVSPKLTLDEFEDFGELEEVVKAATRFQRGK